MKSKLGTYLLITAVAGIWGSIIYKIIDGVSHNSPQTVSNQTLFEFNPEPIAQNKNFKISDVERDPFLGTLQKKNIPKRKQNKKKIVAAVNMPKINYSGIVKNGKDQIFVLAINGKQYLLRKGQSVNEVKLISGNSKQVIIRFNNTNTTILVD